MTYPRISVGMYVPAQPPLVGVEQLISAAEQFQLDSVFIWDHIVDFFPPWRSTLSTHAVAAGSQLAPPRRRLHCRLC